MKDDYKQADQKWGWVIVFGNVTCFLVLSGHMRSFGIFVVPIQSAFDVNAATVGSILTVRCVSGMIAGLCNGYILVPTQIIIGKYFGKWRSLAMSTSSTGGTLGQLILPPLCAFLMEKYSLFGAFLIVGGMSLNCIAAGALQRPFEVQSKARQNDNTADEATNRCEAMMTKSSTLYITEFEEEIATGQCLDVELVCENDMSLS